MVLAVSQGDMFFFFNLQSFVFFCIGIQVIYFATVSLQF